MDKVIDNIIDIHIFKLLELATSTDRVINEYNCYRQTEKRTLYGWKSDNIYVACIGIEMIESHHAEIKHIAVAPNCRNEQLGSKMIHHVVQQLRLQRLIAETDYEAVGFYKSYGFAISCLGEKYPGVERFLCVWEK